MKGEKTISLALEVHEGTDGAMERLVRRYQDPLFNYVFRMLGNRMDAQEVTQDALLRAYTSLVSRYPRERCAALLLQPWLFRIARNLAFNSRRSRRSRKEEPLDSPALSNQIAQPPSIRSTGDLRDLERALGRLVLEDREAVVLRFIEGLSYGEIAAISGGSEAAARGKVFRALKKLRKLLHDQEETNALRNG